MIKIKIGMLLISKKNLIKKHLRKKIINAGKNNAGQIVMRHRGGGIKKKLKFIDYYKSLWNIRGIVFSFDYDPNRSTLLSLIVYILGVSSYIISLENLQIGDIVINGTSWYKHIGCTLLIKYLRFNFKINNLEIYINKGSQLIRSSGNFGLVVKKKNFFSVIKLPSGKLKLVNNNCIATIGRILNFNYYFFRYKKAGLLRLKNWRPVVRGVAMNPVDHPYGGGEGKKSKKKICMSPWGRLIKGKSTRNKKNAIKMKRVLYK